MTQEERTKISRELILEGAVREFGRHGYEDASINRICTENGISKGRLFHHFENKEDIFLTAVRECYEALCAHTAAFSPDPAKPLAQNFHDYFQHRQQYFVNRPYRPLLMASDSVRRPSEAFREPVGRIRERFEEANLKKLREILENSAQAIVPADTNLALRAFHIASQFIHLHVGYPNWNPEKEMQPVADRSLELFDQVVHMLLYGVLPRQGGDAPPQNGAQIYRHLSEAADRELAGGFATTLSEGDLI